MNVDPRTKLVIVLCLSTLAIFIKDVLFLNGVLLITIIISLIFKTNMLQILRKIKDFCMCSWL